MIIKGTHTKIYKQFVLEYFQWATRGLKGEKAKEALINALKEICKQLIYNPKMPYKGGLQNEVVPTNRV